MNWTRCSRPVAVVAVVLALVAAGATPAGAVSVSAGDVPADVQVGEKVSATFNLTDLYTDYDEWTLAAETGLRNATWTVTRFDNRGRQLGDKRTVTGTNLTQTIGGETDEVKVRLEGRVPAVENFTYDPAQSFLFVRLVQTQEGGTAETLESWNATHYTNQSRPARTAIEAASAAIENASASGAGTGEAETLMASAVSAYENANFGNAERLAGQAEQKAKGAAQSKERTNLLLLVGGAVVVLAVVVGAVYWYLNQRETYDKLG